MMSETSPNIIAWVMLFVLAMIWGSSFILMKLAMFDSGGGELFRWDQVAAIRLSAAGLVLLPIALRTLRSTPKVALFWMAMVGFLGNGIPAYLFTGAETQIDSGLAGILNALTPFFTVVVGVVLFRSKVKWIQVVGMVIGFLGAVGLVFQGELPASVSWLFSGMCIVATALYGVSVNIMHHQLRANKAIRISSVALFTAGVPSAIYLFTTDFTTRLETHPEALAGFGFACILGVIGTAVALIIFNRLIQNTSGIFASSVAYVAPIIAFAWGLLYKESLGWGHLFFGLIILSGVYLIRQPGAKAASKAAAK